MKNVSHACLVEIWTDFSCPFCYIAKKNFSDALDKFSDKSDIEVRFKSFQIDPGFEKPIGKYSLLEHIAKKYGQSLEQTQHMFDDIAQKAKESGLTIHFDEVIHANTFFAHKLMKYAQEIWTWNEMVTMLFEAYFRDGKDIGERSTLIEVAQMSSISEEICLGIFDSHNYEQEVAHDIRQALDGWVSGVPFFLFAGKYPLSGMRSQQEYTNILKMIHHEWKRSQK